MNCLHDVLPNYKCMITQIRERMYKKAAENAQTKAKMMVQLENTESFRQCVNKRTGSWSCNVRFTVTVILNGNPWSNSIRGN